MTISTEHLFVNDNDNDKDLLLMILDAFVKLRISIFEIVIDGEIESIKSTSSGILYIY